MTLRSHLTLDDILSIPGNAAVFKALVSALREKAAIAFVGAGASAGMYPLWEEFIGLLADHAVAEGKADRKDARRWKGDTAPTPQQRVNPIVRRLGESAYRNFLKETFGPRRGPDGLRYTATHAALLRLPFRGYVTTNYDPALEFARMDLRPGSLTTGTPTWQDDDEVHRWWTGHVFGRPDDCPILWLHGYWQRPHSIVLNSGEYSAAYKPGLYRRLFDSLWGQRRLVFLGYGFNDPQFTLMAGEYLSELGRANALPRHVAVLGVPAAEDGRPADAAAVRDWRDSFEADYHVRPLFYPVRGGDHSALQLLLGAAAEACGCAATAPALSPAAAPTARARAFAAEWFHEPTNDDKFVGRDDEIARLDRWVRDEAVRAVGVSAVGGTGKTALVGHWLKNTGGWHSRPFAGLFAWSFYQNRDANTFLRELLLWAHEALGTPRPDDRADPVDAALAVSRAHPLVIVLDGLEVLQEGPGDARHGTFLDGDLREFLSALCQRDHRSLAVLTSRFVFTDLDRFLGTAFHQLELHGLTPERGAELLEELCVGGLAPARAHVSERLDGHPLGLRVFAEALPDRDREHPQRFLDYAFRPSRLRAGAPLNDKLRRLLVFYEKKLPVVQARLLSIVALFRSPVADETVLRIARGLFGKEPRAASDAAKPPADEPLPDAAGLAAALKLLHTRGVLTREPTEGGYGSACHPILRDHFRHVLLGTGRNTARRAANLLKGQPSWDRPHNAKEIEPVLLAIELLLDAGEFEAADELYKSRLERGDVFLTIPAAAAGLTCALGFVGDEARRQRCAERLRQRGMALYLNDVTLFAMHSGHFELARSYCNDSLAVARELKDAAELSACLQRETAVLLVLGRLVDARRTIEEALRLTTRLRDETVVRNTYACRGWVETLSGQPRHAAEDFAVANALEMNNFAGRELYGLRGVWWAELLVRGGQVDEARRLTRANLNLCWAHEWYENVAQCARLLGWCDLADGRFDDAAAELGRAEQIFHDGHLLFDLARLHLTAGELALARGEAAGALARAAEALTLAAPRGMRLVHADALVLRGRARMEEGEDHCAARALEDAEYALHIARGCGYAWAERDALHLETDAREALAALHRHAAKDADAAREYNAAERAFVEAADLNDKLTLTRNDLAAAEAFGAPWRKNLRTLW